MKLGLIFITLSISYFGGAQGIRFDESSSWDQILQRAKQENKYIFIDAFATWCGPCKMMDAETYPDSSLGAFMNGNFISVKVQTDETSKDNNYVKSWRKDAKDLVGKYAITGVPTFLFFNPEGAMIHRSGAFQDAGRFTLTAKFALAPERKNYYTTLENYRKGQKDYDHMLDMITTTREMVGDKDLALKMAKDYKKHLEANFEAKAVTKENLDFIGEYGALITSKDKYFKAFYSNPEIINACIKTKDWAEYYVRQTITREELENKLTKNGKGTIRHPDFKSHEKAITKKYPKINAAQLVTDFKVNYYRTYFLDWRMWAVAKEEQFKYNKPNLENEMWTIYTTYNVYGAWDVFLHCNDNEVLTKSLDWINKAIDLVPDEKKPNYVDTKASVLYKLGKVDEAIKTEQWAIDLAKNNSKSNKGQIQGFEKIITKMQNREPIYKEEGAEWNSVSLANITKQ